jgi:hypothetical protein
MDKILINKIDKKLPVQQWLYDKRLHDLIIDNRYSKINKDLVYVSDAIKMYIDDLFSLDIKYQKEISLEELANELSKNIFGEDLNESKPFRNLELYALGTEILSKWKILKRK